MAELLHVQRFPNSTDGRDVLVTAESPPWRQFLFAENEARELFVKLGAFLSALDREKESR